jgi:iron-sulfur cluster assembly protein
MSIRFTESAARQIRSQLASRGRGLGLRVGVKKTGCSGFSYTYDYADEIRPEDVTFLHFDTRIVIDRQSLEFMDGSTIDYVKEGLKQAFKITNPRVDATCGCGESFSVKERDEA